MFNLHSQFLLRVSSQMLKPLQDVLSTVDVWYLLCPRQICENVLYVTGSCVWLGQRAPRKLFSSRERATPATPVFWFSGNGKVSQNIKGERVLERRRFDSIHYSLLTNHIEDCCSAGCFDKRPNTILGGLQH